MMTIEQYAAFTNSIFAGISLWLVWKTKTLTDIVKEMKEGNRVAAENQNLHSALADPQIYPSFIIKDFTPGDGNTGYIQFYNKGQYATHFEIKEKQGDGFTETIQPYGDIISTKLLGVTLNASDQKGFINFSFILSYKDGYGKFLSQRVECHNGNITLSPTRIPVLP